MRKDFHDRCDDKGPTVSIVQSSKNKLSCGYTSVSWSSPKEGSYKEDSSAWLMSLDTLTKYPVTNSAYAVYHDRYRAISFGSPHLGVGSDPINVINGSCCFV